LEFPNEVGGENDKKDVGAGQRNEPHLKDPIKGIPEGYNLVGISAAKTNDPYKLLQETNDCVVIQAPSLVEILCGCVMEKRFDVYIRTGGQTIRLFRCKEESGFCMRQCCPRVLRGFVLQIKFVGNNIGELDDDYASPVGVLTKPFSCASLCCPGLMHPMVVTWNGGKVAEELGKVELPKCCCGLQIGPCCSCCTCFLNVFNKQGNLHFVLTMSICQAAFCITCGKCCYDAVVNIFRAANQNDPVGTIVRMGKCSSCLTNTDNYTLTFPKDATPEEKFMLLAANLQFDYFYFNTSCGGC